MRYSLIDFGKLSLVAIKTYGFIYFIDLILKKILRILTINLLIKKINSYKKRIVIIDVGANIGQNVNYFKNKIKNEKIFFYLIEPNKYCFQDLKKIAKKSNKIKVINKAASINNKPLYLTGFEFLHDNKGETATTTSFKKKLNSKIQKVKSFDLNLFLKKITNEKNFLLILKLDIEGSEYKIINKIIKTKVINKVDYLFIEYHAKYEINKKLRLKLLKLQKKQINYFKKNSVEFSHW